MQRMSFTKKLISLLLIVVMLLTSVPFIAFSSDEDEGTYLVTVKDAISTGIKGVTVVLENTADSTVLDEKTDEDGVATFKNVAYGTYDISYSSDDIISGSISAVEFLDEEHNSTEVTAAYAVDCHSCNGTGKVACDNCNGTGILSTQSDCATCDGTGTIETSKQCDNCAGTGKVTDPVSGGEIDCEICTGMGVVKEQSDCTDCEGSGKITNQSNCPVCGATGNVICTECSGTGTHEAYDYAVAVHDTVEYRSENTIIEGFTKDGADIEVNTGNMTVVSEDESVLTVNVQENTMQAKGKAQSSTNITITIPFDAEHGYAPQQIQKQVTIHKSNKAWDADITINENLVYNAQNQVLLQPSGEEIVPEDLEYVVTKQGSSDSVTFSGGDLPAVKDAGNYTVVISEKNHTATVTKTVSIAKATVTVVPNDGQEKYIGQYLGAEPDHYQISYSVDGQQGEEKVIFTGALSYENANAEEEVGKSYAIEQGDLALDESKEINKNYTLKFDDSKKLTIINYAPENVQADILDIDQAEKGYWFNQAYISEKTNVTLKAPQGFLISDKPNRYVGADWKDTLTYSADGMYGARYYLKNVESGAIAGTVDATKLLANFGIDTEVPVLPDLSDNEKAVTFKHKYDTPIGKLINFLTFGTYFKESIEADVKTVDPLKNTSKSEVENVRVYIETSEGDIYDFTADSNPFKYKESGNNFIFQDLIQVEGTVHVVITDTAGNVGSYLVTDSKSNIKDSSASPVIMLENSNPKVTLSNKAYEDKNNNKDGYKVDEKNVYTADVEFDVKLTDELKLSDGKTDALVSGLNNVTINVNGTVVCQKDYTGSFVSKDETINFNTQGIDPDEEGKYVVSIEGSDNAGNAFSLKDFVYVDRHAPMVTEFEITGNPGTKDGDYKPVNDVEISDYGYYFKNEAKVKVTLKDMREPKELLAGIKGFCIYLDGIIDKDEKNRDVPTLQSVNADGSMSEIDKPLNAAVIPYSAATEDTKDSKNASAFFEFKVPAQFKGQIYAKVIDNAGNDLTNNLAPSNYESFINQYEQIPFDFAKTITNEGYQKPLKNIIEDSDKHALTSEINIAEVDNKKHTGFEANTELDLGDAKSYLAEGAKEDAEMYKGVKKKIPLYNFEPSFDINIKETYSGIKQVDITLVEFTGKDTKETVQTIEVSSAGTISDELAQQWTVYTEDNLITGLHNKAYPVSGNSNDMILLIQLTDRAGNISYDYFKFGIDTTPPVIEFTEDTTVKGNHNAYYNGAHDVTITVTERNFNPQDLNLKIVNDDNDALPGDYANGNKKTGEIYQLTKWKPNPNPTYPDETTYTYVLTVPADGHYSITASLQDLAKNKSNTVSTKFWIDSVAPVVTVEYNLNNDTAFYNQTRVATITVVDHNFDLDSANKFVDFKNESTAKNNGTGADVEVNGLSQWTKVGNDTYSITVTCEEIANYVLKFLVMDMAGNQVEITEPSFDVDTKAPTFDMYITEEKENDGLQKEDVKSAYKYSDTITPYFVVNDDDGNLDTESISINIAGARKDSKTLKAVHEPFNAYADEQGRAEIANVASKQNAEIVTGQKVTLNWYNSVTPEELKDDEGYAKRRERENLDDVYYLTVSVKDKAGNETKYKKVYSVNRYGSNFLFDFTSKSGYRSNYEGNLAFFTKDVTTAPFLTEINPDSIDTSKTTKIVLNGVKELKDGKDYSIKDVYAEEKAKNEDYDNWHEYKYTLLNKDGLFSKDNKYVLSVADKDDAGNANSNTNTKNRRGNRNPKYDVEEICFVVDNNAPVVDLQAFLTGNKNTDVSKLMDKVTVKNSDVKINENVTPQDGVFTFNIKLSEKSLGLEAINFKAESFRVSYGDEYTYIKLKETKTPGLYSFSIPEMKAGDLGKDLSITISDKAGNQSVVTIEKFTATTNPFVKFLANRLAVIITAISFVLVLAAVVFIIIKTRKKAEDED